MAVKSYNPFMYPFSKQGLINIVTIIIIFLVSSFLSVFTSFMFLGFVLRLLLNLIAFGYFFMYLNLCIVDSSDGGLVAPDTTPGSGGMGDLVEELKWGVLPIVACLLPVFLYTVFSEHPVRGVFLILFFAGIFVYPMLSLRTAMFRHVSAFNPVAILFNIIRFFPGYISLVVAIAVAFVPVVATVYISDRNPIASLLVMPWFLYGCIVLSHLIGRFYFNRKDKLDWD
ncbi:MAG: hypothetical protein ACIAQZ_12370 [Sedimentisphaeraceae bacterium JB056]